MSDILEAVASEVDMRFIVKVAIGVVAAGGVAAGAWDYASPAIAAQAVQTAARNHDAGTLNEYIDFDALRTNLKAQFAARLFANNRSSPKFSPEFAASRYQSVNAMVDGTVTPQALQVAMERAAIAGGDGPYQFQAIRRDGLNRFHASFDPGDIVAVRFERRGLSWQVTDLKLPYDLKSLASRPKPEKIDDPE